MKGNITEEIYNDGGEKIIVGKDAKTPGTVRTLEAQGSEANIGWKLKTKGLGKIILESLGLVPGTTMLLALNSNNELITDIEKIPLFVAAPPTMTSPGKKGQEAYDANYYYVCIEDNQWVKYFLGNRDYLNLIVAVPPTLTSAGIQGQIAFDVNYRYECYATNMWYRFPHNREMVNMYVPVPPTLTSTGIQGQMAVEEDYIYYCVAPSFWTKVTRITARTILIGEGSDGAVRTFEAAGTAADISMTFKVKGAGKFIFSSPSLVGNSNKILSLNAQNQLVTDIEKIPLFVAAPPTLTSAGKKGQEAYDANYYYVCIEDNQWVKYFLGNRDYANLVVAPPVTLTSAGIQGQIAFDVNYRYECYATNQWYKFPHNKEFVNMYVPVPATLTSAGFQGQMAVEEDFIYYCVALNSWAKVTRINSRTLFVGQGSAGATSTVQADGTDVNIDLALGAKGIGKVKLTGTAYIVTSQRVLVLDTNGNIIATYELNDIYVAPPPTLTSPGLKGQRSWDGSFLYECIENNTWIKFLPESSALTFTEMYVAVPPTPTSPGKQGERAYDATNGLMYECVATNIWIRWAITKTW